MKKILFFLLVSVCICITANAYVDATTGLVFSISGGKATILNSSGTTAAVTTNYPETIIEIPETVTDVNDPSITGTVTAIGAYAFINCSTLEEITLPSTLTTIGIQAFRYTNKLKKVHIASIESYCGINMGDEYSSPTRVGVDKVIGLYVDGELITDLVIPEGITETKAYSFAGNHSLKSIKLPSTLKTIGQFSFFGCVYVESVDLANVVTIGNYAFSSTNTTLSCRSLKKITIPSTCKSIGTGAFYYCVSLEELVFEPEGVLTTIGNNAFRCNASNKNAKVNSISLPKSVTTLGTNVFDYFTALETFETYGTIVPSLSTSTNLKNLILQSPTYVSKPSDLPSGVTITVPLSLYNTYAAAAEWDGFNIKPLKTDPKADILDVVFKPGDGGAEDISASNYTVTAYGEAHGEYNPHFGKYIGVTDNTPGTAGTNFYRINYASGDPIYSTLPNGFTFETVLQVTQAPSSSYETKWFSSTSSGGVALLCTGTQFEIVVNTTASGSKTWKRSRSTITPKVNDFYHVIGVWDKENEMLNLYVNGELAKSVAAPGTFNWPTSATNYWFSIGGSSSATAGKSNNVGSWKIATQRIYSDALDAEDVTYLYGGVSASIAAANAFESLKAVVATEKTIDYDSDPTVLPSSLVPYKNAMQAAEQVVAEISAMTSGEGKTAEEYQALKQAILDAKDQIANAPVADVLDAKFNADGSATDLSTMGNTIERRGEDNVVEYSKVFGKNIAKFNAAYSAAPNNYYKVDYSSKTDGAMLAALKSGHTLETVFCLREGEVTNVEAKWFSAHQSGGTGFLICTASHGKDGSGNEITFLPNVGGYKYAVSGITPEVGKYYHAVGVWDNVLGKAKIYINGELLNEVDAAGTWTVPGDASRWFCIGGDPGGANAEQGGSWNVATARIYDNPLTSGQIAYLWEQEKDGVLLAPSYERLESLIKLYTTGDNDYEKAAATNEKIAAFVAVLNEAKAMMADDDLKTKEEYTDMADRLEAAYDAISIGEDFNYFNDLAVKEGSYVLIKATGLAEGDKIKLIPLAGEQTFTLPLAMVENGAKYFIPADFTTGKYDMSLIRDNITYAPFGQIQLDVVEQLPAGSRPVAHRGFYNSTPAVPQNSRASFRNALREGFAGSETDVWMTTDGHIIVSHDNAGIQTSTYEAIKNVKLSNGEIRPELKDFLDIMRDEYPDSPCKLQIEIKYNTSSTNTLEMCEAIVAMVHEYGMEDRVNYISYSMPACQKILECNPNADVAFLAGSSVQLAPDELIKNGDISLDYDFAVIKAHPNYITRAAELGINSEIYTVNLESELLTYNKMGVDFIATNYPDVAQEIYEYYQDNVNATATVSEGEATLNYTGKINPDMYRKAMAEVDDDFTAVDLSNAQPSRDLTYKILTSAAKSKNTVFYLPSNTRLGNENNVVVGEECNKLVLTDKENFAPTTSFTAVAAEYTKTISDGGWYSCVLPYAIKVPAGVTVLNNATVNGSSISFAEVAEGATIEANTPFLYKTANGNVAFNATNAAINAEVGESGALKGTYVKIPAGEATGKLILNSVGSAFATASALASIPAFRAYLDAVAGSNTFTITINDDLTGIVGAGADLNAKVDVYTIDGKLVRQGVEAITALQGLEKGTYIVNGTKIKK